MIESKSLYKTGVALGVLAASALTMQSINASDHQKAQQPLHFYLLILVTTMFGMRTRKQIETNRKQIGVRCVL